MAPPVYLVRGNLGPEEGVLFPQVNSTSGEYWGSLKARTHQPSQLLSRVGLGPVGICVIGLQLNFLLHSSLVPDCLAGSGPPYDSTVELGWVMCHGL